MQDTPFEQGGLSRRKLLGAAGAGGLGLAVAGISAKTATAQKIVAKAASGSQVYYWCSHGAPNDQIWVIANQGATDAARDLSVTVHTSFANANVALQEQAITSAISAGAAGIATSAPEPKVLDAVVKQAMAANIPVIMFNSDDPTTGRVAYVGADLTNAGVTWAQYLVSHKLVKRGDTVWLPVEVAGASYQVLETQGIASVFKPLGIKYQVVEAGSTPAGSIAQMRSYLTANKGKIAAMIGLGDQVMSNTASVFKAVGVKPGQIPVVGWGNELLTAQAVQSGYVLAALWQYPDSQGYLPIVLLKMISDGLGAGYNVTTTALYNKATVGNYIKYLQS